MLHERSNITASFAEHIKFPEKLTFTHDRWINSGKSKQKTLNHGIIHLEIAIYRVLHERSYNTASFVEHLKFQKIDSHTCTVGEQWQLKIKKLRSRHYTF